MAGALSAKLVEEQNWLGRSAAADAHSAKASSSMLGLGPVLSQNGWP